ncbi:hypothetical protein A3D11_04585 [Candidatus Peribacteria bacterium RIFCSPHIGHO2_02_FULL_49_16]|nr:MAG: hypothetical protein A2880_04150 [Candidatus Peribacteria bacterium RIFCSPHIGHO2_01_FULL_49_38]OGJ58976.1 MAG: hypothetical protein A3D11_04585 [Candidatus Peribacteria bacterium RIFCSPHIGHO2_02_FULL_49_16]
MNQLIAHSTIMLMVCIGTLIIILAILILLHQNRNATKGYQLRQLERERSQLLLEEEVLRMHVAGAQSLEEIQEDKRIQAMIPPKYTGYAEEKNAVAMTKE